MAAPETAVAASLQRKATTAAICSGGTAPRIASGDIAARLAGVSITDGRIGVHPHLPLAQLVGEYLGQPDDARLGDAVRG